MADQIQFDVFLCHNSEDKPEVKHIAEQLKQLGVTPWLDVWELRPGYSWQWTLEQQIEQIRSAAVFVGKNGIGPWQRQEIDAFLREFVNRNCPVIPVLLQTAPKEPKLPLFLRGLMWVDFHASDPDPMRQLIWGITGIKPDLNPISVLEDNPIQEILETSSTSADELRELINQQHLRNYQFSQQRSQYNHPQQFPQLDNIKLKSEKGIDYTKLRDLLAAGKWKEADQETARVMLQAANREKEGWLGVDDIDNFPCEDLRTINQLWLHYSLGKFGFSVQKEIYQSLGGKREYNEEVWLKFGDTVGWRVNNQWLYYRNITFDLSAPRGHLPRGVVGGDREYLSIYLVGGKKMVLITSSLAWRFVKCSI